MKFLFRFISLLALVAAVIAGVVDAIGSVASSSIAVTPLGQMWFDASPESLNAAQAMVQRYLHPFIWDPVVQWILLQPAFAVFLAMSFVFYLIGYRRRRDGLFAR